MVLLLAGLFLMPAVLGIGVQGRPVLAAAAQQEANPVEIEVTGEVGADLDPLLPQRGQRPMRLASGRCTAAFGNTDVSCGSN